MTTITMICTRMAVSGQNTTPMNKTNSQLGLVIEGVSKAYPDGAGERFVLSDVDLRVEPGELVALIGASGSGKSTLLAIAGGLETATSGSVHLEGTDVTSLDARGRSDLRRSAIGFIFQDFNLLSALNALDNVALPLELNGMKRNAALTQAEEALERLGLAGFGDNAPDTLSGGERQRVAIARAIAAQKSLLLADEPTGSLDSRNSDEIADVLKTAAASGSAVLVVTHDLDQAHRCDRIVELVDGRINTDPTRSLLTT